MLTLYDAPLSGNCYKARLLLAHLGTVYERIEIDVLDRSTRPDAIWAKNPAGRVPVLELDDGRTIAESNAILWFLAEGTAYLPEDRLSRVLVLQWLFFEQNGIEPNVAVVRYWVHIAHKADDFRQTISVLGAKGREALKALDRRLSKHPFLVEDRYTIADISLYAYTHVAPEGGFDLGPYPGVRAWIDRVAEQPGHVPMLEG